MCRQKEVSKDILDRKRKLRVCETQLVQTELSTELELGLSRHKIMPVTQQCISEHLQTLCKQEQTAADIDSVANHKSSPDDLNCEESLASQNYIRWITKAFPDCVIKSET